MTYVPMKEPKDSRNPRIQVPYVEGTPVRAGVIFRDTIFLNHNCSRCRSGEKACVEGRHSSCSWLHARND